MKNKINIAELLKNCPTGMELDCLTFDNVFFQELDWSTVFPIICYRINNGIKENMHLTEFGSHFSDNDAKCIIFPKGKTTWEGFQRPFKDGDVAISDKGDIHLLRTKDSSYCAYRERWNGLPKFDITNLKPFESKVLVRNSDVDSWCPAIFGCKLSTHTLYKYTTMTENYYAQCIPYEGNEHLSGTTNNCDEFYKNW